MSGVDTYDNAPVNTPTIQGVEIVQNFEYLEIPMILRYRLIDRKLGFNVLGGLATQVSYGEQCLHGGRWEPGTNWGDKRYQAG